MLNMLRIFKSNIFFSFLDSSFLNSAIYTTLKKNVFRWDYRLITIKTKVFIKYISFLNLDHYIVKNFFNTNIIILFTNKISSNIKDVFSFFNTLNMFCLSCCFYNKLFTYEKFIKFVGSTYMNKQKIFTFLIYLLQIRCYNALYALTKLNFLFIKVLNKL